jgi:hypothetical protein
MPTHRQTRGRLFFVFPLIAILPFVLLYLWAYRTIGSRITGATEVQLYQHEWQARLFTPAVQVESIVRRKPIDIDWVVDSPFP